MKKILITGAGGYIGSNLVPYLLKHKYRVLAIDRFFFGNYLKKNINLKIIKDDIRSLKKDYFKNVYCVIDLAAISNDPSGEIFKKETFDINFRARLRNAKISKHMNVKKYLLPSSCSNYGRIRNDQIADETFKLKPLTNYSKANSMAESSILKLNTKNFNPTVFRQGTLFGCSPRLRLDLAINGMTYGIFKNNKLPVMRDGNQRRPMLHMKDALRAMKFFIENDYQLGGEIFNVGSNENNYSINDLIAIFKKKIRKKFKLEWYGSPDKRSYFVSFDKISSIGFKAKYNAKNGIDDLLKYFKKNKTIQKKENITLEWYRELEKWNNIIQEVSKDSKILYDL